MPNTYTQIHLHLIFAVQNRRSLIQNSWKDRLYEYITGVVQINTHKMIIINGMPDHLHIVIGMRPTQSLSDLMQDIKGNSSRWINDNKLVTGKFNWQESYGAFTYSIKEKDIIINYIKNQKEHHKSESFYEEFKRLLVDNKIEFDEKYLL